MEIRFLFMVGAQSTLDNKKMCEGEERVVELVWEIGRPVPSLITISFVPS